MEHREVDGVGLHPVKLPYGKLRYGVSLYFRARLRRERSVERCPN
ncbi:hypothetical protein [Calothrix sp. PCC 6303]|nr:hypothetical protein [Calothrix sp. PCC 6303]